MAKRPRIEWKGDLARPIRWNGPRTKTLIGTIARPQVTPEAQQLNASRYERALWETVAEGFRKLELLKDHFGIPTGPNRDASLALRLAIELVPGFQLSYRGEARGRPRNKWTDGACIGLLVDIEKIKEETNADSDIAALTALVRRPNPYTDHRHLRSNESRTKAARSLVARLTEARARVAEKRLDYWFKPEIRDFARMLFAADSPVRQANFG